MSSQNLVGNNVTGRVSVITPLLKSTGDTAGIYVDSDLICKHNVSIQGDLTVQGFISSNAPANAKVLTVPSVFSTLNDAVNYAFASTSVQRFRIVLEGQGPHLLAPAH